MVPKSNSENVIEKKHWYKEPSSIISIISIGLTTLLGILTIRLDREVYVPKLTYSLGQEEAGSIFLEISNQGAASATNVSANINWKPLITIRDCSAQPPYQDVQPIQPILYNNRTYRLPQLQINGTFKVICNLDTDSYTSSDKLDLSGQNMNFSYGSITIRLGLAIKPDTFTVEVIADNAKPAQKVGNLPPFLDLPVIIPTAVP
jgi:hypothetical protein